MTTESAANRIGASYLVLRERILGGALEPGARMKPAVLAGELGVSGPVVREALTRLVGDGLVTATPNKGFAVIAPSRRRLEELTEARIVVESGMLRLAIERGDLDWQSNIVAALYRLRQTPMHLDDNPSPSEDWLKAHAHLHAVIANGCDNSVLIDVRDRLSTAADLVIRWSARGRRTPDRMHEHEQLAKAVLDRDIDSASELVAVHFRSTMQALLSDSDQGDPDSSVA